MSGAANLGLLMNQLDDKGGKNFAELMKHLGEVGAAKFGQIIGGMTADEVGKFARMMNAMPADQMKNLAGVLKNVDPARYLFHMRNPNAPAKSRCAVLLGLLLAAGAAGVVLVVG